MHMPPRKAATANPARKIATARTTTRRVARTRLPPLEDSPESQFPALHGGPDERRLQMPLEHLPLGHSFLPSGLASVFFSPRYYTHVDPDAAAAPDAKNEAWLQARERYLVTASNAAALWDLLPSYRWDYKKLLMKSMEIAPPTAPFNEFTQEIMRQGREFEGRALTALSHWIQQPVYRTGVFFSQELRVAATPDAVILHHPLRNLEGLDCAGPVLVEVKARANGRPLYPSIPVHYFIQMLWQLWLSGCRTCIYLHGRDVPATEEGNPARSEFEVRLVQWQPRYEAMFRRRLHDLVCDRENWLRNGNDHEVFAADHEFRAAAVYGILDRVIHYTVADPSDVGYLKECARLVPRLATFYC